VIRFRYREKGSIIHRLNPFCKLAWLVSILVLALLLDHPISLIALFISTLLLACAADIKREWLSFMKFLPLLIFAIILINALLSYHGETVLWKAPFHIPVMGQPEITREAIIYGLGMSLRLAAIISAFAVITLTVHPDDIMLSLIKMRLPYKSVLVTSLSTRFIPTLIGDAERITDVQRSRALELERGRLHQRIRRRMSILVPLLANSLDRTVQVAEAMDSRAFGGGSGLTYYREIKFSPVDVICVIAALAPLALGIFIALAGYGSYQYYPATGSINLSAEGWLAIVSLFVLLCAPVPLGLLKKEIDLD
jgi:energy-coupling factor transport system permease protein